MANDVEVARTILNLSSGADEMDIKKSFWLLAMKHHPDKNPKDRLSEERFKRIVWAYRYLTGKDSSCKVPDSALQSVEKLGAYFANEWGYFCWWRDSFF